MKISDIEEISKNPDGKGYIIRVGALGNIIIHKRRTIPALLTLIKYGEGCESDLTTATNNLQELKKELSGKIPDKLILDSYADANKPFSELWNEEGFVFILNPQGETRYGSQKYVLRPEDHEKLFTAAKKAERKPPSSENKKRLLILHDNRCNLCGSKVQALKDVPPTAYSKDRVKIRWDHRIPVEKGGESDDNNYQPLCFYCNKCKWQICNFCEDAPDGCNECALAFPEKTAVIYPTKENISDRLNRH